MKEKLKAKLKKEGRSAIWFIRTYLPNEKYHPVMSQIDGFIEPMKPEVKKAIEKYLNEPTA